MRGLDGASGLLRKSLIVWLLTAGLSLFAGCGRSQDGARATAMEGAGPADGEHKPGEVERLRETASLACVKVGDVALERCTVDFAKGMATVAIRNVSAREVIVPEFRMHALRIGATALDYKIEPVGSLFASNTYARRLSPGGLATSSLALTGFALPEHWRRVRNVSVCLMMPVALEAGQVDGEGGKSMPYIRYRFGEIARCGLSASGEGVFRMPRRVTVRGRIPGEKRSGLD